jgi:hypothetical protein
MSGMLRNRLKRTGTIALVVIISLVLMMVYWHQTAPERLISSEPCAPPCWHGIVPGETNKQAAVDTLGDLSFIDPASITITLSSWKESKMSKLEVLKARYKWTTLHRGAVHINLENNGVVEIRVDLLRTMTLREALGIHGAPSLYSVVQNPDQSLYYRFVFADKGLILLGRQLFQPSNVVTTTMEGGIRIYAAEYFPPMAFDEYLAEIRGLPSETAASVIEAYRPWPGLGVDIQVRPIPTPTSVDTMWWKEGLETVAAQRTVSPAETR